MLLADLLMFVSLLHPLMTAISYHLPCLSVIRFVLSPFWPKTPHPEATRRAAATLPAVCHGGNLLHPAVASLALPRVRCPLGKDEEEEEEDKVEEAELERDLDVVEVAEGMIGGLKLPVPLSHPRIGLVGALMKPPKDCGRQPAVTPGCGDAVTPGR